MDSAKQPVEYVLKETSAIARRHRTGMTVGKMAEELGQNSLPAVLALPALAAVTPLSGIPMLSSACGVMICLICLICGALMPLLEVVPFTSSLLGAAVGLLAVAMLTRDRLIALLTLGGIGTAAAALSAGLI